MTRLGIRRVKRSKRIAHTEYETDPRKTWWRKGTRDASENVAVTSASFTYYLQPKMGRPTTRHFMARMKHLAVLLAALLLCSCATDRTTGKKYPINPFAAIVPGDYGY